MSLRGGDNTRRKAAIEFVTKGLQAGALKPVIDRTFTFDAMADVHRYLEQSGQFGKIVVTVSTPRYGNVVTGLGKPASYLQEVQSRSILGQPFAVATSP